MGNRKKQRKCGDTDLLNQYDDYCGHCIHAKSGTDIGTKDHQIWCAAYDEFFDIDRLKDCRVFCTGDRT